MEQNLKMNFLKKIFYSIAQPSKYIDMNEQGLEKAFKYFFTLVCILTLIISVVVAYAQVGKAKETVSYLDENLPQITFKENLLQIENEEAIILDDKKIIDFFDQLIIINTVISKEEAIENYKDLTTEKNNVIVFLREEYIIIPNKYNVTKNAEEIVETSYSSISSRFIKDQNHQYEKIDLIEYLRQRTSFSYYVAQFFVIYFIRCVFLYLTYIFLISTGIWLVTKISKYKWTYKETLKNTIYASTLSVIIYNLYAIIYYFSGFVFDFLDITNIGLIFIYLYIQIYMQNKKAKQKNA